MKHLTEKNETPSAGSGDARDARKRIVFNDQALYAERLQSPLPLEMWIAENATRIDSRLSDVVRAQVEADYAGECISADSIECVIENRLRYWHIDQV